MKGAENMTNIIIGNIVMLIGSCAEVFAGYAKTKNMTLVIQVVKYVFMIVGAVILGAISCAIITAFMILRNFLEYKGWFKKSVKYGLVGCAMIISIGINNMGWIGYIPVVAFIISTIGISTSDIAKYKIINAITCGLFLVNDILIRSYTSAIVSAISIATNVYRANKTKSVIA